ncbi:PP2C family protein-serine/threonine phosphatase [Umezawaea sp. Da 62-37]|uniref:PP2C family protein-serine/threonine phosphatase n=1 Tax=Umezawaea sp. Da 62-37 TaxID=3075927 RepID=UPI0028F6C106|nr:PP2C family protein-serine/threonine phosphatase [Umezawaea sp. Da 62-37]WNV87428.1 PP2C family protein-serine/threonine phosphatase [Umezawaea sp. Da 62-37]
MSIDEADRRRQLATCVERTGLTADELWLRYFALGGDVGPVEVDAYLHGLMTLPGIQCDVLAHAVNERLDEFDWLRRVPYSRQVRQAKPATGPLVALVDLLDGAHRAPPERLPAIAVAAGRELGVRLDIYLVDRLQRVLVPVLPDSGPELLDVDTTPAGRAFRELTTVITTHNGDRRLWTVLLDGTDRLGVLGITPADEAELRDPNLREQCRWLARLLGHLIAIADKYGDGLNAPRQRHPTDAAVELLRDMRPPLTAGTDAVAVAAGRDFGGRPGADAFDYALSETTAHLAIFDSGAETPASALVTASVLAAYRKARRDGRPLEDQARAVDEVLNTAFGPGEHASAVVAELDLVTGRLGFLSTGAARLLLVRDGRTTTLSTGTSCLESEIAVEHLRPRDWLLLHTDGMSEARDRGGRAFGPEHLGELLGKAQTTAEPPPEAVRGMLRAVFDHQHGDLRDDATVLLAAWSGPDGPRIRLEP